MGEKRKKPKNINCILVRLAENYFKVSSTFRILDCFPYMTFFIMTERNCHQVDSNRNVRSCSLSGALVQPNEPKLTCEVLSLFSPKHKSHTNIMLVFPDCRRKLAIHYCKLEIIEVVTRITFPLPQYNSFFLILFLLVCPKKEYH